MNWIKIDEIESDNKLIGHKILAKCPNCGVQKVLDSKNTNIKCDIDEYLLRHKKQVIEDGVETNRVLTKARLNKYRANEGIIGLDLETTYWNNMYAKYILEEQGLITRHQYTNIYAQCKTCGKYQIFNNYDIEVNKVINNTDIGKKILDNITCHACAISKKKRISYKENLNWNQIKDLYNIEVMKKERKEQAYNEANKKIEEIANIKEFNNSKKTELNKTIKEINKNLTFLNEGYDINGVKNIRIKCDICGTPASISYTRIKELGKFKCIGCEIRKEKDINYVGIYNRDISGTVINGMKCQKDDLSGKINIQCIFCVKTKEVNKDDFLNGDCFCDCEESNIIMNCQNPDCYKGYPVSIKYVKKASIKDVYRCPFCGMGVSLSELKAERLAQDKKLEFLHSLNTAYKHLRSELDLVKDFAVSKIPAYYGNTSGEEYKNCRCLKHHQNLVLSETEILYYADHEHTMCNTEHALNIDKSIQQIAHSNDYGIINNLKGR